MKLAAAAYPLDAFADWAAYEVKLTAWVAEAAGQGADLLVFPEYGAMELASLDGIEVASDMERWMPCTSDSRLTMASISLPEADLSTIPARAP
jgi:predicted amidohydrolase